MRGDSFLAVVLSGLSPVLFLLLILGLLLSGAGGWVLWRPPVLWTDQFGATKPYVQSSVVGIAVESNALDATGYLNWTYGGFGSNYNVGTPFVKKYSPTGNVLWIVFPRNISQFHPSGISVGSNGIYIVGTSLLNKTIVKYDFNGAQLWSRETGSSSADGVISATTDSVYFAWYSHVQKYDSSGNKVWTSGFSNEVVGIHADPSNVYILTRTSLVKYDQAGTELWSHPFGSTGLLIYPQSISEDSTGVYVSGFVETSIFGPSSGFLSSYDSNGKMVWTVGFDSPDQSGVGGSSVWSDSSGIYLFFDSIAGNGFVTKYDSNHGQAWSFQTPDKPAGALGVASTAGELFLAGGVSEYAFVEAFTGSASLIFFGLNPPRSFAVLATLVVIVSVGVLFLRKRYSKRMSKRPGSASPDRYRKSGRSLNPRA